MEFGGGWIVADVQFEPLRWMREHPGKLDIPGVLGHSRLTGDLDMGSSDIVTVDITLRYSRAYFVPV